MCGIAGAISFNSITDSTILFNMVNSLKHRGPDKQNILIRNILGANVALGHARLSIIDLSDAGSQPMTYKQYSIVYNGEAYNYIEIKNELINLGHCFTGHSDTEVILHAFDQWGEKAIDRFIGMFAFILLDEKDKKIHLYRDRAGVKPLYYYWNQNILLVASELKALTEHPEFPRQLNHKAVAYYFKMGYIPAPLSIYDDTFQLMPGHSATLDLAEKTLKISQYWNPVDYYMKPNIAISYQDAKDEIKKILLSAINYRMVSDVPVGIFLSGGYDSTTITAMLQKDRTEKLKTFTIGFEEGNNEAPFAKETAKFLGTDHFEYICTAKEAQAIIPELPYYYDEPFADSSAIPTMLVSRMAKKEVTVALSADGGDEIFTGYNRYPSFAANMATIDNLRFIDNRITAKLLKTSARFFAKESFFRHRLDYLGNTLTVSKKFRASHVFEGSQAMPKSIFKKLMYGINYPALLFRHDQNEFDDVISLAQVIDYQNYLPNDILTKVDRASMSVSLESREPLLDHRLFEFAAQLPTQYKFDGTIKKKILKDLLKEYVPEKMMDRPKTGFSLPIASWLRGDLSYLLDEYLNASSIKKSGVLNEKYVGQLLRLFKNKRLHDESIIWRILQFQMWYRKWMDKKIVL
ncbi:MAG: asparagine synthase (glutamine-hydrolyzing) [Ginsengibacter sp.]